MYNKFNYNQSLYNQTQSSSNTGNNPMIYWLEMKRATGGFLYTLRQDTKLLMKRATGGFLAASGRKTRI